MRSSNPSEAWAHRRLVTQSRPVSQGRFSAVCIATIPSRSRGPFSPAWRGRIRSRGRLVRWWRLVANSTSLAATRAQTPVRRPLRSVAMCAAHAGAAQGATPRSWATCGALLPGPVRGPTCRAHRPCTTPAPGPIMASCLPGRQSISSGAPASKVRAGCHS